MFLDALSERGSARSEGRAIFDDLRAANDAESPVIGRGQVPVSPAAAVGTRQRHHRRRELRACSGRAGDAVSRKPAGVERAPHRRQALEERPPGPRRRAAGGFLLPAVLHGGGLATGVATTSAGRCCPVCPWCSSAEARTTPGPPPRRRPTTSTSSRSRSAATTIATISTRASAARCPRSTPARSARGGAPDQRLTLLQTVHGVVQGYATVGGRRVALALQRSTRGREIMSVVALQRSRHGAGGRRGRASSRRVAKIEAMFNVFYVDDRDIAYMTTGRLPIRAPGTDPALPTSGTGEFDWRGIRAVKAHPQAINPASGVFLDWNSKPAVGWARPTTTGRSAPSSARICS